MGGSDYDREVYSAPAPAAAGRAPTASAGFSAAASQVLSQRGLHQDVDPRGRALTCEAKSPVVVAIDVTGSMGNWTKIIYDKLPMFYGQLKMQGYLEDPSISFAAVGDHASDRAPLQACDFAQGLAIDDMVAKLWLEGGGGFNRCESYELAAHYYASGAVSCPGATSKPFFFFTGDEGCYDAVEAEAQLQWLPPGTQREGAPLIFERLKEKYQVFLLKKPYMGKTSSKTEAAIKQQWRELIGQDRILMLSDPKAVVDIMLGVVAVVTGSRTTEEFVADLVERGQTEERRADVRRMLQQVESATRMDP